MQHVQRVDTTNCSRNGQAHCVAQRFFRSHDAILNRLAIAPQTLHAEGRDAAALNLRKHLLLEATIGRVKAIERHLDGVEWIVVRQHFEMDRGALMSGETNKTDFTLFFCFIQGLYHATSCKMQIRIILIDDFVNLP